MDGGKGEAGGWELVMMVHKGGKARDAYERAARCVIEKLRAETKLERLAGCMDTGTREGAGHHRPASDCCLWTNGVVLGQMLCQVSTCGGRTTML